MEESKTLVEQLRDTIDESRKGGAFPTWYAGGFITNCPYNSDVEYERELFTTIADRIEREYMPLPRFEDGEPVKVGDTIDGYDQHGAKVEAITDWGGVIVRSTIKGGSGYPEDAYPLLMWDIKDCKRHMPEVLDADGVPIHVGDTVYLYGDACEVTEINKYGISGKVLEFKPGYRTDFHNNDPLKFTHKQPDSLERIEADAMKMFNDYWGCGDAECSECPVTVDGKRPHERYCTDGCAAAQRLDLLRRQRELLEMGQE